MRIILVLGMMMLASAVGFTAPVQSMVAARSAVNMSDGGNWENPYVTDGLVAMWDGEWNVGPGIHDANAIVWKDLIGNVDLSIKTSVASFSSNSFHSSSNLTYIATHDSISYLLFPKTIEIVFKRTTRGQRTCVIFATGDKQPNPRRIIQCTTGGIVRGIAGRTKFPICSINIEVINSVSFCYSSDTVVSMAFQNGIISQQLGYDTWGSSSEKIGIGAYYNSSYGFEGDIYSIRLYNRELTAEEIQHNYLVDKERFNLP